MNTSNNLKSFLFATALVLVAGFARVIPHPWNMTPVAAVALFGGAYFANRFWAVILPLLSLWLSDLYLNNVMYAGMNTSFVWFYEGFAWQYVPVLLTSVMAMFTLRRISTSRFVSSALATSLLFFFISNFGVWSGSTMYAHNFGGLIKCYAAGIPFLGGTIIGTLIYGGILFFAMEMIAVHYPKLAPVRIRSRRK